MEALTLGVVVVRVRLGEGGVGREGGGVCGGRGGGGVLQI